MSELLTVDEVARECRVHPITIRRHIAAGRLRAVRIGRRLRIRREDLESFGEPPEPPGARPKTGVLEPDDPLFSLVGIIEDSEISDISSHKYRYLAAAMDHTNSHD